MNYYKKYLKYKEKYLCLKNQLGKGVHLHEYNVAVPEFFEKTKEEYKSNHPRPLNVITIHDKDVSGNDYEPLKRNILFNEDAIIDKENSVVKDFLDMVREGSDKIIEINGFYNKFNNYVDDKEIGTYVKKKDFPTIFKDSEISSIPTKTKIIDSKSTEVFLANEGVGKKHLHRVMNEYKSKGKKYVSLIAAGKERLVDLYKRYGFKLLLNGYNYYFEIDGIVSHVPSEESIMFGDIDDIIAATC